MSNGMILAPGDIKEEPKELGDSVLYCIGGVLLHCDENTGRYVYQPHRLVSYLSHSLTTPRRETVEWLHNRMNPGTVIHDHKLYIFGGKDASLTEGSSSRDSNSDLETIEVFELKTKWLKKCQFLKMKCTNVCSFGGYIYFCKGFYMKDNRPKHFGLLRYRPVNPVNGLMSEANKVSVKSQVEDQVKEMANLLFKGPLDMLGCSALLPYDDHLYAIFGGDSHTGYLTMQRYNPATDEWSWAVRTDRHVRIMHMSATVHRGKIYALSDRFGLEVFCPGTGTELGSWTRVADAPNHDEDKIRSSCIDASITGVLASINDRLVSVGDSEEIQSRNLPLYEFDFEAAVWIRKSDVNFPRRGFTVQVYNPSV